MDLDSPPPWAEIAARIRCWGPLPGDAVDSGVAFSAPTLVGLPDGRVSHLVHVLEGQWFCQRVRACTTGRRDLWVTSALAPITTVLIEGDLPLVSGGLAQMAEHLHTAILGPPGWLPEVQAGGLLGLRLVGGSLEIAVADESDLPPSAAADVRNLIARHYRNEFWWVDDEPTVRHTLTRAIAASVLEDPTLLTNQRPPLDELLIDPLQEAFRTHWRDASAWRAGENVSFCISGMPSALHSEIARRAAVYGMSEDQYVILALGHLAWRTPFAEDMEPWDSWFPEAPIAKVLPLTPPEGLG